jgi:hypothetical protein
MTKNKGGQEEIRERLSDAIDELRKDVTRVEVWATALGTFSKPVPEYQPDDNYRLLKDPQKDKK